MKAMKIVFKILMREKKDIVLSVVCGFIAGVTAVALFSASGYLISKSALTPPLYTLTVLVATVKLFGITSALSRYGERYFSHRGTFTMLSNLRVSFYKRLEPLAPAIFGRYRSGDLLARIVGDVESLQNTFLRVLYPPIVLMLIFFSTIFFTTFFSIEIAFILFLGLLFTTLIVPAFFAYQQSKVGKQVREVRGNLSTEITEFLYGFRDLKIYQQLEEQKREIHDANDSYLKEQERERVHQLFSEATNTFISFLVTVFVMGIGAYLVVEGELDGILLAMLVMISLTVFENTTSMASFPSYFQESKQAASRLVSVVQKDSSMESTTEQQQFHSTTAPQIEFNQVSFTFPGEERPTLKDISLKIDAGSKTAVVGPSGSGKSTLFQLILNLYRIDEGKILLNDLPIESFTKESIWSKANVVLQTNHFFYGTIRSNLQIAKENVTDSEMNAVLKKVDLEQFSLDSPVLERGENLSGGEKQRLAIARTMLRNARLWLLDEPTSSLDALTEAKIYEELFTQAENDTVVLISHRLKGLEKMDQIIVMDQGKIVEAGTYHELINQKGYFYELKMIEQNMVPVTPRNLSNH